MKILYIADTGEIVGGGEISLLGILKNIDRTRFTPVLACPAEGKLSRAARSMGVDVFIIPYRNLKNPLNIPYFIKAVKKLAALIKEQKIGLLHTNSTGGVVFWGGLACRLADIPLVSHVRIFDSGWLADLSQAFFSAKIIVVSKALAGKFRFAPSKGKYVVIYNGVDTAEFRYNPLDAGSFRAEIGCAKNRLLVGTVGSYHRGKGFEYYIKAAKIVNSVLPDTMFLIAGLDFAGAGAYRVYLAGLIRQYGLADNFVFLCQRQDIARILCALDVFVFSSFRDSFGRVLVEAMACQRPCVAFGRRGVPEIIDHGTSGILVRPKDSRQMADQILYLLKHKDIAREYGLNARSKVEDMFSIQANVSRIQDLYKEVMSPLPNPPH